MKYGVGQPVRRVEDFRFLRGEGEYSDDIDRPGQVYACLVRSPHAHADIRSIDTKDARALSGILAVYTGADLAAKGVSVLPCIAPVENSDGSTMPMPAHGVLATDRVRHVGDPVAVVVAETPLAAADGAEAVWVEYESLPAIADTEAALNEDAPQVWPEAPGNLSFDWDLGSAADTDAAFATAHHVTRLRLINNRVAPSAIEPRAAVGEFDARTGKFTLYAGCQGRHVLRDAMATAALGVEPDQLRIVTNDVGGGFGAKIFPYAEPAVALWAARELGRPVKWTASRNEIFLADAHARDHVTEAELALDADGKFLAMRVSTVANMGAYLQLFAPLIPTDAAVLHGSPYAIPATHVRVRGAYTHTVPVDAYRGAGKPEAAYVTERLVDAAAREMSIPRDELRLRNFVRSDQMPYGTATGIELDSGDFAGNFEKCLQLADRDGFAARRTEAETRGNLRGLGYCYYMESTFGVLPEFARVEVDPAGILQVHVGTQSSGQGHETAFAQLISERLGVPFDSVRLIYADSERLEGGGGSLGSRSIVSGGAVLYGAAEDLIAKGKDLAVEELEAAREDIDYADGQFTIQGTDRSISLFDLSAATDKGLQGNGSNDEMPQTYPNGAHICEVEVDPQTGVVSLENFSVVHDCGILVNPLIVEGQVHGGIGQGIGQALLEHCIYDSDSSQQLTGSFMDYGLPRAGDMPDISVEHSQIPCKTNKMGFKGVGEAGTTGAPPALVSAVLDALSGLGVTDIGMPLWPETVWKAIRAAE
jgi:aerobic carbon-monoxide dehydrogenase large subunit